MAQDEPAARTRGSRNPRSTIFGLTPAQATKELERLYGGTKKLKLVVEHVSYANLAFIQVSSRDVFIDFTQAPGDPQGSEIFVRMIRIYLPHTAAKSLGEVIGRILEKAKKAGQIETL